MKICIVGGGNIGSAIAAEISQRHEVIMLTSRPEKWGERLESYDVESGIRIFGSLYKVTNDYSSSISESDVVILTVPSFLMQKEINKISDYIRTSTILCVVPGSGGTEFICRDLIKKGVSVCGLDRVTHVSRVKEYGHRVQVAKKRGTRIAGFPNHNTNEIASLMSKLLQMNFEPLNNFLTVTFTPSNPIVHTSRLFAMLEEHIHTVWDHNVLFYGEWDDHASEIMLRCDDELQRLCRKIENTCGLDMRGVISLQKHYGVRTARELTQKMKSIKSMNRIESPMIKITDGFVVDLNSRYFQEDFPYGLAIIKSFAELFKVETETIDEILKWYCKAFQQKYYYDGRFNGIDLKNLPLPQNYGVLTPKDVSCFYRPV